MCGKHLYHGTQYLITLKNRGKGIAKCGQSTIWNSNVQGRKCLCSHGAGGRPAHELGSIVCQALCSWRCSARVAISLEGSAVLVRTVEAANDSRVSGHTGRPIVDPPASWFCLAKTPDPWDPGNPSSPLTLEDPQDTDDADVTSIDRHTISPRKLKAGNLAHRVGRGLCYCCDCSKGVETRCNLVAALVFLRPLRKGLRRADSICAAAGAVHDVEPIGR